ncbi:beta-mannosidase [Cellulomonas sp. WB94]|uniref:glycosyl hydrolase 2 galactose-binding domain-containing protein n=1 Tax=Cellulomonas sp. WB94 TaxID=2173174 RepID=UPI000D563E97|nr:glycoside hydrolase family 2 TIM barrel-domain containing protein [Cellulomonas sp. WB94]PVU83671.1 beta-mannosidase [Cellulomonas sp. WB94]
MITQDLHDGWTLRAAGGPVPAEIAAATVPAQVPGSVHTDLLAAGLIPDPYLDLNESALAWMHRADWRYELPLTATAPAGDERVDLAFDGLDTVATIELDGAEVGHTANQHRSYRFDVRDLLGTGEHTLAVHLRSALEYAEAERERLGRRPSAYEHPLNMVRKMACSFGWDWGPDLQTAGIWKAVRLERWRTARIAQVRPLVTVDAEGTGRVAVHVDIERAGLVDNDDVALVVRASLGGSGAASGAVPAQVVIAQTVIEPGATTAVVHLELAHAPLWWPVGHGEQPLVDLDVTIDEVDAGAGGAPLDEWHRRIGFRTVEIDTRPDEIGAPFTFVINGRPIFAKGANWIPDDHLLTRITRDRLARRVDQALGANLNLLRVWGGGIYETDDFYDVCDEKGILVWQDFPLACSAYPEEEPLWSELEAEARQNVARLTPHPSLVLWNGGNENLWGFMDWGWQEKLAGATWGYRYYTELFPSVVAELDPTRPYVEGSPCSPGEPLDAVHPNDLDHGTHHQWEVWNRVDYTVYRDEIPRFCSEFGFQAPPTWATLERAVRNPDGAPLSTEDPVFLLHQKAEDGNGKLDRGLAPHLGVPTDFADWHWATQLNQARAVAYAIEHYRSWWPRTAGAIVWQLNDCWPVTSWSAVDSDERPKPLWYALRHANADRTITIQRRDAHDVLSLVNDTSETWRGTVHLSRQRLDGTPLAAAELTAQVGARSAATIALPDDVRTPDDPSGEVLVAELDGVRTSHTWVEDVALRLDPDPIDATVTPFDDGYRVEVRASSLARDVTLLVDRLDPDARVDDALVTLAAGTSATFTVRTTARLTAAELTGPSVLRSANDLARSRTAAGPDSARSAASVPAPTVQVAAEFGGPVAG